MCCENFEKVGAEIRPLEPKKLSHFFSVFGVIFTQPNFFVHSTVCFVVSLYLLGSVNIMGDVHGSCFIFCTLCVFAFLGVSAVLAVFAHFWILVAIWVF